MFCAMVWGAMWPSALVAQELERYQLAVTLVETGKGRGLTSALGVREDTVVCKASCLFYDFVQALKQFLQTPGSRTIVWMGLPSVRVCVCVCVCVCV